MIEQVPWRWILGTALSMVCLALALRGVDLGRVWEALGAVNPLFLILALGTVALTVLTKAVRWQVFFRLRSRQPRFMQLFMVLVVGQMFNIAIPGRVGDLARAYLIGDITDQSVAFALGTVALEKMMDLVMSVLLFVTLLPFVVFPVWLQSWGVTTALAPVGLFGFTMLVAYQQRRALRLLAGLVRLLPPFLRPGVLQQMEQALDSLEALRNPRAQLQLWMLSAVGWGMAAMTNYLLFLALALSLSYTAALFLLLVIQLGVAVPSSPGKVGVFQYLCLLALGVFGVERDLAFTYSFLLYAVALLPLVLCGALFLGWGNIGMRRLSQQIAKAAGSGR